MGGARLDFLSKDELHNIHAATLEILEDPGLEVPSKRALRILEKAGADVDYEKSRVSMPSHLVKEALKSAPKTIRYGARNPKYDLSLEGKETYFTTDGTGTFIRDFETGERRTSTAEDLAKWAVIADYLPMIHVFWPSVTPADVPEPLQELHTWVISLSNTEKHVEGGANSAKEAQFSIEIAVAIMGGKDELKKRPIISAVQCPVAPLRFDQGLIEANIEFAQAGIPVVPLAMPMAGGTAPVTLAGTLAVTNAEVLGSLVISEFASPGSPVLYGACPSNIDFRTGIFVCSPEGGLLNVALAQLAHYYGLPSEICGGCSDSKTSDAQAAYERTLTLLPAILAGPDIICGMGGLEAAKTMAPELLVIDNEILEAILRLARGFEVNEDSLALDIIRKVGPGGHYLAEKHTLDRFRREHWLPKISDRRAFDVWEKEGEREIYEVAREKARKILATHKPEPIPNDTLKDISQTLKRYEKETLKQ